VSPGVDTPETSTETAPATAIPDAGSYLVNVVIGQASCLPNTDGCGIGTVTAASSITAQ